MMRWSILSCCLLMACPKATVPADEAPNTSEVTADPNRPLQEGAGFYARTMDAKLKELWHQQELTGWQNATDITLEHEAAAAAAEAEVMAFLTEAIPGAARFDGIETDEETRRMLDLLKLATSLPAPKDEAKRTRLAEVSTKLGSLYGKSKWCPTPEDCKDLGQLEAILSSSDDPAEMQAAWEGWRTASVEMGPLYAEMVQLTNEGAKEIGFEDTGAMWRSGYDMPADDFKTEVDRLWSEVKPLYDDLHCHVRAKLGEKYGAEVVPQDQAIPAHLLGNMWAQEWTYLYDDLVPYPKEPSLDVTEQLVAQGYDHLKMVRTAESFFTSIGLDPLPQTFWERSMFVKPEGKEAVCHASAWDIGMQDDLRIKMCIRINMEDLQTIHHELGHNYYYHYYYTKPALFQSGAHDGFHEAIGDTITLSMTPSYLNKIGLLDAVSESDEAVLNAQMKNALGSVAFLPFGRLIDQWRWDVFSGEVSPEQFNAHWWALREQYQGIRPPAERPSDAFDPGAKYHIPGNTPYTRYFLSYILQYQFHEALCRTAGHEGPVHTCSIYGNKDAGAKLQAMLEMGASKPWPDALEQVTGTREMSAKPLLDYYSPLHAWLKDQNKDRSCGWSSE